MWLVITCLTETRAHSVAPQIHLKLPGGTHWRVKKPPNCSGEMKHFTKIRNSSTPPRAKHAAVPSSSSVPPPLSEKTPNPKLTPTQKTNPLAAMHVLVNPLEIVPGRGGPPALRSRVRPFHPPRGTACCLAAAAWGRCRGSSAGKCSWQPCKLTGVLYPERNWSKLCYSQKKSGPRSGQSFVDGLPREAWSPESIN